MGRWNDRWVRQRSVLFLLFGASTQTVALEFDAVSVVNDAVQDGVTEGRIGDDVVPLRHGHLACDQERSFVVAIVDDLEKVAGLLSGFLSTGTPATLGLQGPGAS